MVRAGLSVRVELNHKYLRAAANHWLPPLTQVDQPWRRSPAFASSFPLRIFAAPND
jgi:hypothetical protein